MANEFKNHSKGLDSPGDLHFNVTPNDGADLTQIPRVLYIGTGGTLVVRDKAGVDVTYSPADNSYILISAIRVLSTGTTATGIIGVY